MGDVRPAMLSGMSHVYVTNGLLPDAARHPLRGGGMGTLPLMQDPCKHVQVRLRGRKRLAVKQIENIQPRLREICAQV